jgi:lipopolysaccharide biosynthesis regulator YciM
MEATRKSPEPQIGSKTNIVDLLKQQLMKGVTVLIDEKTKNKIVQANIKHVVKNPDEFENLIFSLVEEYRKRGLVKRKTRINKL